MLAEVPPLPLFTYGTLLDPVFTGRLLEREVVAERATLSGYRVAELPALGYRVLAPAPGERVEGRLYRGLGAEEYRRLDAYEGVAEGLYERRAVTVESAAGAPEAAFVYLPTERTLGRYGAV